MSQATNKNTGQKVAMKPGSRVAKNSRRPKESSEGKPGTTSWKNAAHSAEMEEINEAEQCVICAGRIEYAAMSSCSHTTCHTCTFRQRALYKRNNCLVCRTENEWVIISEEITKTFQDFTQADFRDINDEYGINFTSHNAAKDTLALLDLVCPMRQCKAHRDHTVFKSFKALNDHVKGEHDKYFCEICALNKKAFISELKVYNHRELQRHKSKGDEEGFNGHPPCQFCSGKRFYSDDELFVHMRQNHEKCHVCERINPSQPQYFKNYDTLSKHFRDEHYVCNVQSCLDQKFVVFMDEFDLKAHMIKEHQNLFGGDKNLLSIGNIGYGNTRRNGFGSQLSTVSHHSSTPNNNSNNNNNNNNNNRGNRGNNNNVNEDEDVDSVELKKMRLEERARHYLNYDAAAFAKFKEVNKKYESYKLEAEELLKAYQGIFDKLKNEDLAILVYEFSQTFESNSLRRKRLVEIHQELSKEPVVEEEFPSLPGASRSYNFTGGSWGSSITPGGSRRSTPDDFPALPTPAAAPKLNNKAVSYKTIRLTPASSTQRKPVIKTQNSANISSFKNSYLSGTTVQPSAKKQAPVNEASFPALPTVVVKRPPRVNPIKKDSGVWGDSSGTASPTSSSSSTIDLTSLQNELPKANGKNQKKKKQLLFHVGI